MSITATSNSAPRELTETGNHIGICTKMVEIGSTQEIIMGVTKQLKKVNLTWELSHLTKVFKEERGAEPLVISKEFTLSMGEKANLRLMLESWRGSPFTDEQAKSFDITVLLGKPCMINVTHKASKADASKKYDNISAITPVPKGMTVPKQFNPSIELSYDKWNQAEFDKLPEFLQTKMKSTPEYQAMFNKESLTFTDNNGQPLVNDLPFDVVEPEEQEPLF